MRAPEPPFFVWDGDCGFCGKWAGWLEQSVRPGVPFIASQDLDDLAEVPLTESDVARASWWVPAGGPPRPGAAGIATALSAGEPRWARMLGFVLSLPAIRSIARFAYRRIADNRHRLPAPDLPAPERHPVDR
jgi:predicted DCC family thiol-disulfide oxidoreductase YuxK